MAARCEHCEVGAVLEARGFHRTVSGRRACAIRAPRQWRWEQEQAEKAHVREVRRAERAAYAEDPRHRLGGWLGVDVGWVYPAADSDGNLYEWTRRKYPTESMAHAGPVTIRRSDGSVVVRPAYSPREAAIALSRATPASVRAVAVSIVVLASRTRRGVALEDWSSFQRRKPAWVAVYQKIATYAEERKVDVVQVNRAYTSITCPRCNHKARENRVTRDRFVCVVCGLAGQADFVAAINIARRAEGTFSVDMGMCTTEGCDRHVWRAGLCASCYRYKRRTGEKPPVDVIRFRRLAPNLRAYRELMREREAMVPSPVTEAIGDRLQESYRTHDAWGNPLPEMLDGSQACN